MPRHTMLSFNCCVHKFLRCLLELLLRGLWIGVCYACLVFDLDVDWLSVGADLCLLLLLRLGRLVATIHSIVHHASSVKRIVVLLLVLGTSYDRATNYSKSAAVLGLALLLKLGASLDWTGHSVIGGSHITCRIFLHLGIVLGDVCVL